MKLSLLLAVRVGAVFAACMPAGERDSLGRYSCNVDDQYTNGLACEQIQGCHVLIGADNKPLTADTKSYADNKRKRAALTEIDWTLGDDTWIPTSDNIEQVLNIGYYRLYKKTQSEPPQFELGIRVVGSFSPRIYEFTTAAVVTYKLTVFETGDYAVNFYDDSGYPEFKDIRTKPLLI